MKTPTHGCSCIFFFQAEDGIRDWSVTFRRVLFRSDFGHFSSGLEVAQGLARNLHPGVGAIFALLLLDASIVGASAVTLATSYAFGDVFGVRQSLNRRIGEAKTFYGSYTAMVLLAASVVLIPNAPLGLITTAVQVLAGILLPSATVFALLLCNDPA